MRFPVLQSRDDVLRMFDEADAYRATMLDACAALPAAKLADPVIPGTWAVPKVLAHLAWAEGFMLAWVQARPEVLPREKIAPEPAHDVESLRAAFAAARSASVAFLRGNAESVLAEPCRYGRDARPETVGGVFFHLIEHEIHHRAFALYKLRALKG